MRGGVGKSVIYDPSVSGRKLAPLTLQALVLPRLAFFQEGGTVEGGVESLWWGLGRVGV